MPDKDAPEFEEQDQSEVFDEDNYALDSAGGASNDMKTLEEIPDVYDVTSAVGDADDEAALIAEDLDDEELAALEADAQLADLEDDELAERMPESLKRQGERWDTRGSGERAGDEVDQIAGGDLDDLVPATETADLEAAVLSDDAVEDLGYDQDDEGDLVAQYDGKPGDPVRFEIVLRNKVWVLTRDGRPVHEYGHAERAVHEAAEIARELRRTGEPAVVYLEPQPGAWIEITDDEPADLAAEADEGEDDGADLQESEEFAVVRDRSTNA